MTTKEKPVDPKQITRHHLTPASRGGENDPANIIHIRWWKHQRWHKLFGVMVLEEIIIVLSKAVSNGSLVDEPDINLKVLGNVFAGGRRKQIKDTKRVIIVLERIRRMKGRL